MNRFHPYSIFLFTFLAGSSLLITALNARPFSCSSKDILEKVGNAGPSMTVLTDPAPDQPVTTIQPQYELAALWVRSVRRRKADSYAFQFGGAQRFLSVFDPEGLLPGARAVVPPQAEAAGPEIKENLPDKVRSWGRSHRSARKFKALVERQAARFKIEPNLIFAIIKTESNFNTRAVSPASAYGLMQLVPEAGGRAAYKMVYGEDVIPTGEYLKDPDKNIELGTAYLRHLAQRYFDAVENADSREYCLIAAYNTGPANVYRAFGGNSEQAINKINSLSPSEVYTHLTRHLPYRETRNYLPKVVNSRQEFVTL